MVRCLSITTADISQEWSPDTVYSLPLLWYSFTQHMPSCTWHRDLQDLADCRHRCSNHCSTHPSLQFTNMVYLPGVAACLGEALALFWKRHLKYSWWMLPWWLKECKVTGKKEFHGIHWILDLKEKGRLKLVIVFSCCGRRC